MSPPSGTVGNSNLGLAVSDLKDLPSLEDITKGVYAGAGLILLGGLAVLALSWTAPSAAKGTVGVLKHTPGLVKETVLFFPRLFSKLWEGSMEVADNIRDGNDRINNKKE
jgi:hypothetical protein